MKNIFNGKIAIIAPEGLSWNPYCESYAMTASLGLDGVNRFDDIAIISTMIMPSLTMI